MKKLTIDGRFWGSANFMTSAVMYANGIDLDVNALPIAVVGMAIGIDYNIYS